MERDGFLRIVILLYGFVPKSFASVAPKTRACFPGSRLVEPRLDPGKQARVLTEDAKLSGTIPLG